MPQIVGVTRLVASPTQKSFSTVGERESKKLTVPFALSCHAIRLEEPMPGVSTAFQAIEI
mgnify:CR=1 FL=1